jgi:diguanylate cyclase (GGDEF)-like protein
MKTPKSLPVAFLVSNDPAKIDFFKKNLNKSYYVMDVSDCESALEWVKKTQVSLIFLDFYSLTEPLSNFCKHLRNILGEKKVPIFLISYVIQKTFFTEALQAGVTDFIHEPLDATEVQERIAVHLSSPAINKKMTTISKKIKPTSLVPKNTNTFLDRTLMRDQTLQTIIETRKIAMPLGVFIIQIDSLTKLFKHLEEKDVQRVIEQVERILKGYLRPQDLFIKEGSDKYLILLPKTSQSAAKIIAEEIQQKVSSTPLSTSFTDILLTVSIGVLAFDKEPSGSAKQFEQLEHSIDRIKESLHLAEKIGNTIVSP